MKQIYWSKLCDHRRELRHMIRALFFLKLQHSLAWVALRWPNQLRRPLTYGLRKQWWAIIMICERTQLRLRLIIHHSLAYLLSERQKALFSLSFSKTGRLARQSEAESSKRERKSPKLLKRCRLESKKCKMMRTTFTRCLMLTKRFVL